jgi:hypothetical protein
VKRLTESSRRLAPVLLIISVLGIGPAAKPAAALCIGGSAATIWDPTIGAENPRTGTCDNDHIYRGAIRDTNSNGSCAYVDIFDTGVSYTPFAYSCTPNDAYFTFTDSFGYTFESQIRICNYWGCGAMFWNSLY